MMLSPYNPTHINMYGLGCTRFARRYSGYRKNLLPDCNGNRLRDDQPERKFPVLLSIPPGTEMFHFPGYAPILRQVSCGTRGVSPFGHFRVTGCLAPYRNLSQPYHVLHRFLKPRHPPYALNIPQGNVKNRFCVLYVVYEKTPKSPHYIRILTCFSVFTH